MMQTLLCQIQEKAGSNYLERLSKLILLVDVRFHTPLCVSEEKALLSKDLEVLLVDLKNYVGEYEKLANYLIQGQEKKQDQ